MHLVVKAFPLDVVGKFLTPNQKTLKKKGGGSAPRCNTRFAHTLHQPFLFQVPASLDVPVSGVSDSLSVLAAWAFTISCRKSWVCCHGKKQKENRYQKICMVHQLINATYLMQIESCVSSCEIPYQNANLTVI